MAGARTGGGFPQMTGMGAGISSPHACLYWAGGRGVHRDCGNTYFPVQSEATGRLARIIIAREPRRFACRTSPFGGQQHINTLARVYIVEGGHCRKKPLPFCYRARCSFRPSCGPPHSQRERAWARTPGNVPIQPAGRSMMTISTGAPSTRNGAGATPPHHTTWEAQRPGTCVWSQGAAPISPGPPTTAR